MGQGGEGSESADGSISGAEDGGALCRPALRRRGDTFSHLHLHTLPSSLSSRHIFSPVVRRHYGRVGIGVGGGLRTEHIILISLVALACVLIYVYIINTLWYICMHMCTCTCDCLCYRKML